MDKIAAGEVVERPASVVKELVENSFDAGARRVEVSLDEGGRKLIRVTDDGCGIDPDQLSLAVKSHATSKLSSSDDLFRISTLGFRGEALASIASVSSFRVASCVRGAGEGAELRIEHLEPASGGSRLAGDGPRPCAHPEGTTIEARSLFFNVPARRAFLKGARAELRAVEQELEKLALARFDVDLSLVHEGRQIFHVSPTDEPRERIADLFSRELSDSLVAVGPRSGAGGRLRGYASPLDRSRGDARQQFFFLNGRAVRDRVFLGAVRDAYANLLPPRRHPIVLLWVDLPPEDVDVNVHPTKSEVRFRRASDVYGLIVSCLRGAINGSGAPPPPLSLPRRLDVPSAAEPGEVLETARDGGRAELAPRDSGDAPGPSGSPGGALAGGATGGVPLVLPFGGGADPGVVKGWSRFFQLHRRYVVEETERGFRLVDPHALHERLLYDEILDRLRRGALEAQRLLFPVVLEVGRSERAGLEDRRPLLEAMGFELASFGPNSLALHAAPRLVSAGALPELVRELLGEPRADVAPDSDPALDLALGATPASGSGARRLLHGIAAALACKAAVKFGTALGQGEIETLLGRRDAARAACCPHGRPTALAITLDELDRRFGR